VFQRDAQEVNKTKLAAILQASNNQKFIEVQKDVFEAHPL
jgi:hypothetical protein